MTPTITGHAATSMVPKAASPEIGELISGWAGICGEVHKSRVQLWRDIRAGTFPAPIELGPNSIGWYRSEVEEWKRSRPRRTYGRAVTAAPEAA